MSCSGFIQCTAPVPCGVGESRSTTFGDKYVPGDPANLVEPLSGGVLGVSAVTDGEGAVADARLVLNIKSDKNVVETMTEKFIFSGIVYKLYNVKKEIVGDTIKYTVLTNEKELYIGPENLVVVRIEVSYDGGVYSGWMSRTASLLSSTAQWDGYVSISQDGLTQLSHTSNVWLAYYENDPEKTLGVRQGDDLVFQSYDQLVVTGMSDAGLNPYSGGIMQKQNTSSDNCSVISSQATIVYMQTGRNEMTPYTQFGKGVIDYCTTGTCGKCSLSFFRLTMPSGCIKGEKSNPLVITALVISLLLVLYLAYILKEKFM